MFKFYFFFSVWIVFEKEIEEVIYIFEILQKNKKKKMTLKCVQRNSTRSAVDEVKINSSKQTTINMNNFNAQIDCNTNFNSL